MSTNIDEIALQIETEAGDAVSGLDSLINKLSQLKTSTAGVSKRLNNISTSISRLKTSSLDINNINFKSLQRGLDSLANTVDKVNRNGNSIPTTAAHLKSLASGLNSSRRSIESLAESSKSLKNADISGFTNKLDSLSKLSKYANDFEKFKNTTADFSKSINSLKKGSAALQEFVDNINKLNELDKFQATVSRLVPSLNQLASSMSNAKNASQGFKKTTRGAPSALGGLFSGTKGSLQSMAAYGVSLYSIKRALGWVFTQTNNYIETLNLFNVVMGSSTKKAWGFIQSLESIGVDMEQAMRYQASFYDISKSMGIAEKNAYTLSEQFTKLTYDYASLYNMNVDDAFLKLESAITGELEPIRRLGKDISEARLQQVAMNLGIQESVRTMSQAEKAELRFIAVMQQSGAAMNDMERTINQPANALRVLRAQFVTLAREIGNLFIPIITAVLPYLIAFVKVVRTIISSIASLFGINKSFTLDFNIGNSVGMSDDYLKSMAGNSDNVADTTGKTAKNSGRTAKNLDKSAKAMKKLKDFATGIDELNILKKDEPTPKKDKTPSSSGAGGVGGGGGGGLGGIDGGGLGDGLGLDLEKFGYENVLKDVKSKADEIYDAFMKWRIPLTIVLTILGGVFALNKIAKFLNYLSFTKNNFLLVADALKKVGSRIPGVTALFGALTSKLTVLGSGVLSTMGVTATGTVAALVGLGTALAAIAAVAATVHYAMKPAIEQVDEFRNISEETSTKLKPVVETWKELDSQILKLDWSDKVITDEDIEMIKGKVHSMVDSVLSEVDSDQNTALKDIELLAGAEGISDKTYQKMLNQTNGYYGDITKETKHAEKKINEILKKAKGRKGGLKKSEVKELRHYQEIIRNNAVETMSESEEEQMVIMTRLKHNKKALTVESASELLQEAQKNKKNQLKEADDWRVRMLSQLDKNFGDQADMSNKEYAKQVKAIDKQYNNMTKEAEDGYDDIYDEVKDGLGDQAKYLDKSTGKMKSKFGVFMGDLKTKAKDGMRRIGNAFKDWEDDMRKKWNNFWSGLKTRFTSVVDNLKEWWGDIKDAFDDWKKGMKNKWDNFWDDLKDSAATAGNNDFWNIHISTGKGRIIPDADIISPSRIGIAPTPSVKAFARGGFIPNKSNFINPDAWMAGEAGKELIGSYKGHTTVMPLENTSFVSAVGKAVYDAVKRANEENETNIYLESKTQIDSRDIAKSQEEYKYKSGSGLIRKI